MAQSPGAAKQAPPTQAPHVSPATVPGSAAVMPTYARQDVAFTHGEGAWLVDTNAERYLDFTSGIAVNTLGHAHPRLIKALSRQAETLWHTSNLFRVVGQENVAERLCALSFADAVFFCNSGSEACEGAIKAARRYHYVNGQPQRQRIITFTGAFHGRTLAALSAAGNPKYLEGFAPDVAGFDHVAFGDHDALQAAIGPETAAIMIEPVQGEGGARAVPLQCLKGLRALCDQHGLLLIFDEVQTGIGRTGKLFAHEWAGITPDIMAVAKGLGGGFPVGAFLATAAVGSTMSPGTHGSTFGGNPLAMAVASEILDCVTEPGFLDHVQAMSEQLRSGLAGMHNTFSSVIRDVRGQGLLVGLQLADSYTPAQLVSAAREQKLLVVGAGDNTVRLLPPLIISSDEIADALSRLKRAVAELSSRHA